METNLNNILRIAMNANEDIFYRIGTNYYKLVKQPMSNNSLQERLIPWSADNIRLDNGKEYLKTIVKLDGFCLVPEHIGYRRIIKNFYNRYSPLPFKPQADGFPTLILKFVNHIFGNQLELGLDYIKILYEQPTQLLPILCLVSKARMTGKSTFINLLQQIFGENATLCSNSDFGSSFNSDWATKILVCFEEALLNKRENSERFKALSTALYTKVEAKGKDRVEIENFVKFILCSNNEDDFIYLDKEENRFWIRNAPSLDNPDPFLFKKMVNEIPSFLAYLQSRSYSTENKTRMWFTASQIHTRALDRLKSANSNKMEFELATALISILDNLEGSTKEIDFTLGDAALYLKHQGLRNPDSNTVKRLLQNSWNLKPKLNSNSYARYIFSNDGNIYHTNAKGRFYTLSEKMLSNLGFCDAVDEM